MRTVATMVGLSLAIVLAGAGGGMSAAPSPALPTLSIQHPEAYQRVNNPVLLIFQTTADLSKLTSGSPPDPNADPTAPTIYLQFSYDSTVVMPTAAQIEQLSENTYQYEMPRIAPGFHTVTVFWGDAKTHRPVGRVASVYCFVTQN